MDSWQEIKLAELGELNRGKSKHRPRNAEHLYGGAYPFLQTGDVKAAQGRITSYSQTYSAAGLAQSRLWPAGTIAITIAANIAETAILTFPACFPDSVVGFIANAEVCDGRFIGYKFQSLKRELQHQHVGTGSVQDNINLGVLNGLKLLVPPLNEQRLIADLLSLLDEKIELNRRMNQTLEAMAQAIFRDWFVDFGPTRRKMAGVTNPCEIMGGLVMDTERAQQLADLFPTTFDDDGLPEGWSSGVAGDLIAFNPKEPLKKGTLAPYSDMSSLPTSGSIADEPTQREFGSGMRFRNGDALLARITPCLENGKAAFVDFLPEGQPIGWGSTEFIVLRSRVNVPAAIAYLFVRHPEFRAVAIGSMTGTSGRQRAQVDRLEAFPFTMPTKDVLTSFGEFVTPMFDKISANGQENRSLAETRDLLLPKLMSGEISIKDAEAIAEAAQ